MTLVSVQSYVLVSVIVDTRTSMQKQKDTRSRGGSRVMNDLELVQQVHRHLLTDADLFALR